MEFSLNDKTRRAVVLIPLIFTVVFFAVGYFSGAAREPSFSASSTLMIVNPGISGDSFLSDGDDAARYGNVVLLLRDVFYSREVESRAEEYLSGMGYGRGELDGGYEKELEWRYYRNMCTVKITSDDPSIVVDLANAHAIAFAEVFRDIMNDNYVNVLDYASEAVMLNSSSGLAVALAAANLGLALSAAVLLIVFWLNSSVMNYIDRRDLMGIDRLVLLPRHDIS